MLTKHHPSSNFVGTWKRGASRRSAAATATALSSLLVRQTSRNQWTNSKPIADVTCKREGGRRYTNFLLPTVNLSSCFNNIYRRTSRKTGTQQEMPNLTRPVTSFSLTKVGLMQRKIVRMIYKISRITHERLTLTLKYAPAMRACLRQPA